MKILFVENRFRTRIWETFADCLINDGHQVLFLVQNHLFHPRCGRVWVIPYPNKTQLEEPTEADRSLILSDRNINYFGHRSTGHYTYYRKLIRDFLEKERPDVTFGESTASMNCRRLIFVENFPFPIYNLRPAGFLLAVFPFIVTIRSNPFPARVKQCLTNRQ